MWGRVQQGVKQVFIFMRLFVCASLFLQFQHTVRTLCTLEKKGSVDSPKGYWSKTGSYSRKKSRHLIPKKCYLGKGLNYSDSMSLPLNLK